LTVKSEWRQLQEEMDKITCDLSDKGFAIEWAKMWNRIEPLVDKLIEKAEKHDRLVKLTPSPKLIEYSRKINRVKEVFYNQPSTVIQWMPDKQHYSWGLVGSSRATGMLEEILEIIMEDNDSESSPP